MFECCCCRLWSTAGEDCNSGGERSEREKKEIQVRREREGEERVGVNEK